jgi:hypothetical protein
MAYPPFYAPYPYGPTGANHVIPRTSKIHACFICATRIPSTPYQVGLGDRVDRIPELGKQEILPYLPCSGEASLAGNTLQDISLSLS